MKQRIFGPRIGKFVISILFIGVAIVILTLLTADTSGQRIMIILGSTLILIFGMGMVWWLGWPIRYSIDGQKLEIQTGKVQKIIDLENILSARSCLNFSLANNWSFNRVRIEYLHSGSTQVEFIAPDDRSSFLEALSDASPELVRDGEIVVRKNVTA